MGRQNTDFRPSPCLPYSKGACRQELLAAHGLSVVIEERDSKMQILEDKNRIWVYTKRRKSWQQPAVKKCVTVQYLHSYKNTTQQENIEPWTK